jgi:hypothetical protein
MMPSAARDPKTLAGGVNESQDRRLEAVELGFPLSSRLLKKSLRLRNRGDTRDFLRVDGTRF